MIISANFDDMMEVDARLPPQPIHPEPKPAALRLYPLGCDAPRRQEDDEYQKNVELLRLFLCPTWADCDPLATRYICPPGATPPRPRAPRPAPPRGRLSGLRVFRSASSFGAVGGAVRAWCR